MAWQFSIGILQAFHDSGPTLSPMVVYLARLDWLRDKALTHCALLSRHERSRTALFRGPLLANRYATKCVVRRLILGEVTGTDPGALEFSINECGKPHLTKHPEIGINSSDADDMFLFAVSKTSAHVGVDIERVNAQADHSAVVQMCFCHEERVEHGNYSRDARTLSFFRTWSRKEAYIKALGGGLSLPLQEIRVSTSPHVVASNALITHLSEVDVAGRYALSDLAVDMPFVACAAYRYSSGPACLREVVL